MAELNETLREAVRERDEPYGDHGLKGFGLDPER